MAVVSSKVGKKRMVPRSGTFPSWQPSQACLLRRRMECMRTQSHAQALLVSSSQHQPPQVMPSRLPHLSRHQAAPGASRRHPHSTACIIHAIGPRGKACSDLYLYGAAQAMALAASTSSTTFDPHSMDLPSIGALVAFYHACLGFPVKQTWLDAVKAGNCDSFDGLTYSNVSLYYPDAKKTILGHLAQQRQNVRSTKPNPQRLQPHYLPASLHLRWRCLPIKSSSKYTPSAGCTQTTQVAFQSRRARATSM